MPDPVILSACRTAVGTAFRGTLTETSAFDLAEVVTVEALRRSGLDAARMPPAANDPRSGAIDIALPDGSRVSVDAFVDEQALARVLRAMKGAA